MKYLLALLLLTSNVYAQNRVALTKVIWGPDAQAFTTAAYEDGECALMEAGYKNLGWYIAYELPDHRAPDSVTFVLSANCEFYLFSGWSHNNHKVLGYSKNTSGDVTVAYQSFKRDYCVGVSVSGLTQLGDIQYGTVCVDAAYAWYPTLAVDPVQTLIEVQQVQWYTVDGRPAFYGTRKEIKASGLKGMYFTHNNKYISNELPGGSN